MIELMDLHQSMQNTISQIDAFIENWTFGTLIVEDNHAFLALEIGEVILLDHEQFEIEIRNGDEFMPVTLDQVLTSKTVEGWPLYAGLDARIRQRGAA
ncbi:hypothetical protein NIE88_12600 [Sporolactobacillus shoreicorticis]|uniref:Uncharacterized protein n=1 Tax=Sporolactobacillus shoreicorticis TaxID=1923877 RepID=A0ABW5S7E1_9BACL|nr:hypothetical protein [Sporolactobacillus shoreicorticis]MCO7126604.1 hypothetical protein [Sporolactobacillus shoreicorticis]